MKILALDPGKVVGWASSGGLSGYSEFNYIDHGERLHRFMEWIDSAPWVDKHDLVIWDQPFARGAEGAAVVAMAKFIEAWCWRRSFKRLIVPMNSVKKSVLGNGRATNTDVMKWAEQLGYKPANHHEGDALALLYHAFADIEREAA